MVKTIRRLAEKTPEVGETVSGFLNHRHSYLNHRFYPSAIITDLDLHLWTLFFTFYEINWVLSST